MNLSVLEDSLMFSGSLFQSSNWSSGAETENAREPYDAKQNLLGCSRKAEDECRSLTGAYLLSVHEPDTKN